MEDYDYLFKIITLGNKYVGKASYIIHVVKNIPFEESNRSEIGIDFVRKYYYY